MRVRVRVLALVQVQVPALVLVQESALVPVQESALVPVQESALVPVQGSALALVQAREPVREQTQNRHSNLSHSWRCHFRRKRRQTLRQSKPNRSCTCCR